MRLSAIPSLLLTAGLLALPLIAGASNGKPPAHAPAHGVSNGPSAKDLASCCTPGDADFPKVGGNLGNQNYTALTQINKGNIRQLGAVWMNSLEGGARSGNAQSTAVVVDGVIYIETAQGNLHAVDGKTGEKIWSYNIRTNTRRGVAVGDGKVYSLSPGNTVVALDKDTGELVWERSYSGVGNVSKVAVVFHDGRLYVGTNDGNRAAALMVDANSGELLSHFFGAPGPGEIGNDTWEGNSWQVGGATPWVHPAIDPESNLVYWTFGNARGNRSSQDGSLRGGKNLFANSIVALDLHTGEYRWHFQSVHHDIWDMDNVMSPVLADVRVKGEPRKVVVYGSKTGMFYMLDRIDGTPVHGIDEIPVPQDPRQKTWPTQPFPRQGPWTETCIVDQPLGTEIPGDPNRAVPNYEQGCLYAAHWDVPVLSTPGHGGGANWAHMSFSPRTNLIYTGFGYVPSAHSLTESSNGLRPPGEYQTGGIVAVDVRTNEVKWKKNMPYSLAHGNGILTTATDLLFIGQPDGNLLGMDAVNGREIWRFQTGAAISSSPVMYEIDGEQYMAVFASGTSIPYGNSAPRGDFLWAFKLGGTIPEAEAPEPPVVRRPVSGNPVDGSVVNNTVVLARTYSNGVVGSVESTAVNGMAPTHMRVPVGTTVTFTNPETNQHEHCATQFFEGLFNFRLQPGQSATYTFNEPGEYFFNDCFSPRPTGKIEVQ